jgi:SAM-dependent methyltransferase
MATNVLETTTSLIAAPAPSRSRRSARLDLFLVSFLILFLELACIRWFASSVIFLTFFTNIVLLASFLGTGVGCLVAGGRRDYAKAVIPLALAAVCLSAIVLRAYDHPNREDSPGLFKIDVGGQQSPQQVYFGAEFRPRDPGQFVVPIEIVAVLFYILIAMMFVGLGQVMGRAFAALPDRVAAYSVNVAGSLLGIVAFGAMSYLRTPPYVWFLVGTLICLALLDRPTMVQVVGGAALLLVLAWVAHLEGKRYLTHWSPYYKVHYEPQVAEILTNNIGHQSMKRVEEKGPAYALPHLLNRDAGGRPFEEVLIVGAGSGNDVQAALDHGARHVDAVEIDPVIYEIGRADHPARPYSDPRVSIHLDDGRSFVKRTARTYDLIVYALVDSLVLHSGYSSLRLESFLFTEQAFRDIKAKLRPGGVLVMYNFYRQGWVAARLARMAEETLGSAPVVISLPHKEQITPSDQGGFTLILAGLPGGPAAEAIRGKFEADRSFWIHRSPRHNEGINAFGASPPEVAGVAEEGWERIGPSRVVTEGIGRLPTDDWPFLYLKGPLIPDLNLRGMALIAVGSLALLLVLAPDRSSRPNGQMFFLGAGFMLLETKGVVHMALLFGSTWVVNSFVFAAILVMILLSNLFVLAFRPTRLWPYYALLAAALLANVALPMETYLALPGMSRVVVSCAVVFVPVFFAGVIFATAFRDSRRPAIDFGSNLGGVLLGGLSENLSLIVGFNHLIAIAAGFYALSALLAPRGRGS